MVINIILEVSCGQLPLSPLEVVEPQGYYRLTVTAQVPSVLWALKSCQRLSKVTSKFRICHSNSSYPASLLSTCWNISDSAGRAVLTGTPIDVDVSVIHRSSAQ